MLCYQMTPVSLFLPLWKVKSPFTLQIQPSSKKVEMSMTVQNVKRWDDNTVCVEYKTTQVHTQVLQLYRNS